MLCLLPVTSTRHAWIGECKASWSSLSGILKCKPSQMLPRQQGVIIRRRVTGFETGFETGSNVVVSVWLWPIPTRRHHLVTTAKLLRRESEIRSTQHTTLSLTHSLYTQIYLPTLSHSHLTRIVQPVISQPGTFQFLPRRLVPYTQDTRAPASCTADRDSQPTLRPSTNHSTISLLLARRLDSTAHHHCSLIIPTSTSLSSISSQQHHLSFTAASRRTNTDLVVDMK